MKEFIDLINDEPQLQAAARSTQQALHSLSKSTEAGATAIGLFLQWCQRDNVNAQAQSIQRRQKRRSAIFSGGGPDA